jgi:putative ABC transport system ATP-binding protein
LTVSVVSHDPIIECRTLTKVYPEGNVAALRGVTLTIPKGQYVAIRGPSGCGKSTLLNLLGGLDLPTEGEIRICGQAVRTAADTHRVRLEQIGYVFQAFHLLPTFTALENVQVPMFEGSLTTRERVDRARELLKQVGMEHRSSHLPTQLSGGERQRIAIARALANDPPIILADEPTGNLDTKTGKEILDHFDHLHRDRGITLVCVTHGEEVSRRAERVVEMLDGRVHRDSLPSATPAEVAR